MRVLNKHKLMTLCQFNKLERKSNGHKQKSEIALSTKVLEMSFLFSTFHHAESLFQLCPF